MPATPTITTFAGLSPPFVLSQLDANLANISALLASFNNYGNYLVDSGAVNAYVVTCGAGQTAILAAGLPVQFKAVNANTGPSTLNVNGTGILNIVNTDGTALKAGQIPLNGIASVMYDGTQYMLLNPAFTSTINLGTPVASTSGTAINFTGIPVGVKRVTINLAAVSTNGTSPLLIQIGASGAGIETTGYLGAGSDFSNAVVTANSTTGFLMGTVSAAAEVIQGTITLTLENSAAFTWCCAGMVGWSGSAIMQIGAGRKSIAAVLDRVRITTSGGVDTFDAGEINITYE
jgi:hypothetical protein